MTNALPAEARAKLALLAHRISDARALLAASRERIQEVAQALSQSQQRAAAIPELANELAPRIGDCKNDLERLRAEAARRFERLSNDQRVLTQLRHWIDTLPRNTVPKTVQFTAEPKAGEQLADAIERVRREIKTLQAKRKAIGRAPLPKDELKAKARELVARKAARGAPRIETSGGRFEVEFTRRSAAPVPDGSTDLDSLAWLAPELIVAALEREIDAKADDPLATGGEERAMLLQEIADAILTAELMEEALVEKALAAGQDAVRRPRADPRAVLGVELVQKVAAAA